jgi:cell division protein ZapA
MAVAIVNIAGRSYRLGCDEGQEKRLEELAASVDGKIAAMRENVGEIGDQRLVVMAAIEIADEAADARARIAALEAEVAALREDLDASRRRDAAIETRVAQSFEGAATRLERLARQLSGDGGEPDSPL